MEVICNNLSSFNKGDNKGERWNKRDKRLAVVLNEKRGIFKVSEIRSISYLFIHFFLSGFTTYIGFDSVTQFQFLKSKPNGTKLFYDF